MLLRHVLLVSCLIVPHSAFAATIIFEAVGELTTSVSIWRGVDGTRLPPPIGTPYSVQVTFDPANVVPTPLGGSSACNSAPASLSLNLGGVTFASGGGNGFTNSLLPGTTCTDGGAIEFFFTGLTTSDPNPWPFDGPHFLLLSYRDLLFQDAFPTAPTPFGPGSLTLQNDYWRVDGAFTPAAASVEQPTAVPEPGTMLLVGIGLAVVARRRGFRVS
jgi:hypothetical protein